MKGNIYHLAELGGLTPPSLPESHTGRTMSSDNDNVISGSSAKRRDVTLNEQRVHKQLDQIAEDLKTLIRLEERHRNLEANHNRLEDAVDEYRGHLEGITVDLGNVQVRLARYEDLKNEVETLKISHGQLWGKLSETREKQSGIKSIMAMIGTSVLILIGLLSALGFWENAKTNNTKVENKGEHHGS